MNARVSIDAGVCGFRTEASVASADDQNVSYAITSDCEKIKALAEAIASLGEIDAYEEISPNSNCRLLTCCHETLKGCCAGCAVPVGLFKAMQVAAGLALHKDIQIHLTKE